MLELPEDSQNKISAQGMDYFITKNMFFQFK